MSSSKAALESPPPTMSKVQLPDGYFACEVSEGCILGTGILRGKPLPYKWANQTWFYPDSLVEAKPFLQHFENYSKVSFPVPNETYITWKFAKEWIVKLLEKNLDKKSSSKVKYIMDFEVKYQLHDSDYIKRAIFAEFLNDFIDPFSTPIDHFGNFIR
jgi:hypothetical protein